MAVFKHRAMKWIVEAVENLVVATISVYLHEQFETFLGDHWMSRWVFTTIVKFLIKKTLVFMLGGLATFLQNLTVGKSLTNILSVFRKQKIVTEVTEVIVDSSLPENLGFDTQRKGKQKTKERARLHQTKGLWPSEG